jgi:hypothetical protein
MGLVRTGQTSIGASPKKARVEMKTKEEKLITKIEKIIFAYYNPEGSMEYFYAVNVIDDVYDLLARYERNKEKARVK